jgi:very-short-patch-repair endonuclease
VQLVQALLRRQHGAILRSQALRLGLTDAAIRTELERGRWLPVERGLYVVAASPDTRERQLIVALLGAGESAVLSHQTAGAMYTLFTHASVVDVSVEHGTHHAPGPGRVVHQARAVERTKVGTFPVTTPRRTLLDLAAVVTPAKLEPMLDEALMRNLVALEPLLRYLDGKTQRGVNVLRRLLVDRRDGVPQEEMEREFKRLVRRFKLPTPKLQHPFGENKRIDAAYPQHKIAIELDSWRHHGSLLAFRADRPRQNVLELDGWMVLRFTWDAIKYRPGEVAETLVTALGRRATTRARPTRASRSRGSG